jgi:PDZ domain-containing protein
MNPYLHYNITKGQNRNSLLINLSIAIIFITIFGFIVFPTSYVEEKPGPVSDVLGWETNVKDGSKCEVISTNADEENDDSGVVYDFGGKILLLTVTVSGGPSSYSSSFFNLLPLFNNTNDLMPQEVVYPPGKTKEEAKEETKDEMSSSQGYANAVASQILEHNNLDSDLSDVKLCAGDVGGPSGGLAFTLGIIQKVGGLNLTQGRTVAITGTIDSEGNVGAIGGIKEKAVSAYNAGARLLIAPDKSIAELRDIPNDLQVIGVSTISDAVDALLATA